MKKIKNLNKTKKIIYANFAQIYPEDRGLTLRSEREKAAALILQDGSKIRGEKPDSEEYF